MTTTKRKWTPARVARVARYRATHKFADTCKHFKISSAQIFQWKKSGMWPAAPAPDVGGFLVSDGTGKAEIVKRAVPMHQLVLAKKLRKVVIAHIAKSETVTGQDLLTLQLIDSITGE